MTMRNKVMLEGCWLRVVILAQHFPIDFEEDYYFLKDM